MLELFSSIRLNKADKIPLYLQLSNFINEKIAERTILPETKLPSVRQLSAALKINQVTVVTAYHKLEAEGLIVTMKGSGTYVSILPAGTSSQRPLNEYMQDEIYQPDSPSNPDSFVNINEQTINFASATPEPDLFPVENFKTVLNEVLERDRGNAFGYQDSQGYLPLRESIAALMKKDGLKCTTESIHIISGAQQGIDIISKALLRQGDSIVAESPTYTGAIAVFRSRGAQIFDVDMQPDGPDMGLMEYRIKTCRPKLIYSIPTFQNPTGFSYSNDKRKRLLELADIYDCFILEDDYVSDLDFNNRGFLPLKALDKNERVIFIKSFSKIFMPGLRLGFMIVPPKLSGAMLTAKHTTDISTSGLIQRSFDLYIRKGFWDSHFSYMYKTYSEKYEEICKSIDKHLVSGVSYSKPGGGLNIWLELPAGFPVNNLARAAASANMVFAPGSLFYSSGTGHAANSIRLSFAAVGYAQIETGINKLFELISRFLISGRFSSGENSVHIL